MKKASQFTVQRGWKIMLTDMGLNPAHVLSLAGLPADLFSRREATLSPAIISTCGLDWNKLRELRNCLCW